MSKAPPALTVVCALYKFVDLPDYANLRQPLLNIMNQQQVRGTLLLAAEGINGTIAGSRKGIDFVLDWLRQDPRLGELDTKESLTDKPPFMRSKVKLKKEIVTMGVAGIDPRQVVGTYVEPKEWNALISDPDVLVIDTRNDYEYQVGTFRNAINPKTTTFREFPGFVHDQLDPGKHKKIAMFCTGGIRCEKSTALLKQLGFEEVFHLKGGILKYLEDVPEEDTLWEGECFVFDDRITVNHRLEKGAYDQCFACRLPITEEDKTSDRYEAGISCPHCYDSLTPEQKAAFAERQKQLRIARARGEAHLGAEAAVALAKKREEKRRRRDQELAQREGELII